MPEGPPLYLISQVEDISKRKELEEELRVLAQHDPLTKLINRQRFAEEFSRLLAHVARYKSCGALFILDLDNFKQVNDTRGHAAGDEILVTTADILRHNLRITDIPARLGGDEFAILLPEIDMSGAKQVAQKLLAAVRAELREAETDALVTASIGITLVDSTVVSSQDSATIRADHAMYESKRRGGDCFTSYEEVQSVLPQQLSETT
jgi:diguanylate cyclase (GGDEF)-like protein